MKEIIKVDQAEVDKLDAAWSKWLTISSKSATIEIEAGTLAELWRGCLGAAKVLSPSNYWTGDTSAWQRYQLFRFSVWPACRESEAYQLGALAAPLFKRFRKEPITMNGVPIRMHAPKAFHHWAKL